MVWTASPNDQAPTREKPFDSANGHGAAAIKISNRKIAARLPRLCSRQVERRVIPDCCDFTMGSAFSGVSYRCEARWTPQNGAEGRAGRLTTIPGVDELGARVILAEIGRDMRRFPTAGH